MNNLDLEISGRNVVEGEATVGIRCRGSNDCSLLMKQRYFGATHARARLILDPSDYFSVSRVLRNPKSSAHQNRSQEDRRDYGCAQGFFTGQVLVHMVELRISICELDFDGGDTAADRVATCTRIL